jgi:hypothetical protein
MTIETVCQHCGFRPATIEQQSPGEKTPPGEGDYWLCKLCGYIHVYGRGTGLALVTRRPTGFELMAAMVALPEMIEMRNQILARILDARRRHQ